MADKISIYHVNVRGRTYRVEVGDSAQSPVEVKVDGESFSVELAQQEAPSPRPSPSPTATRQANQPPSSPPVAPGTAQALKAPMPGKILAVKVKVGDRVRRGDGVCVLEAMKMEQMVRSTLEGVVKAVLVQEGQMVAYGATMVELA